jgi:hypothetical protein
MLRPESLRANSALDVTERFRDGTRRKEMLAGPETAQPIMIRLLLVLAGTNAAAIADAALPQQGTD